MSEQSVDPNELCKICRGKFSEHQGTIHAFTPLDGDLVTKPQAIKRVRDQQRPSPSDSQQNAQMKRLLEMLLNKGLLTDAEAMFVILGPPDIASIKASRPSPEGP